MSIQENVAVGAPPNTMPGMNLHGAGPAAHPLLAAAGQSANAQYTLGQMLAIWASVALPMGLMSWVVVPFLIPRTDVNPGILYLNLIVLGMVWQGVVAYVILRQEVKPFTWRT